MRIIQTEILIDSGNITSTSEWINRYDQICKSIQMIQWPPGSGHFALHNQSGKKRGEGNGVKPIKSACMIHLHESYGWHLETRVDLGISTSPGPMDATCDMCDRLLCVEWETGNISSSHRALNKMCLAMLRRVLIGGVLILPTRKMYHYLTDRVGNFAEIEPYFPLWRSMPIQEGILAVIAIEHDTVSLNVPRIKKGTDGRALQ